MVLPDLVNGKPSTEERHAQRLYWKEHSQQATVEAMMLDSQASVIDKQERPEVLQMLGNTENKRVLELGAGIGRFTAPLAASSKSITAVDFMDNLIQENAKHNAHHGNATFLASDVMELAFAPGSFDIVFSNWLLMYLGDAEIAQLANRALEWLDEGGVLFFRESCFRQSGDKQRGSNPTHYRNPRDYFRVFDCATRALDDGRVEHFELISCKCVDTYVRVKHNQNQVCWKWRKVVSDVRPQSTPRAHLDARQYTRDRILRYERAHGPGFVSTGGLDTTRELVGMLRLQADQRVLDVGCGVGGGAFFMARERGVYVHAIDLSMNMVLCALERANTLLDSNVSFEIADVATKDFGRHAFDVVFSKDAMQHVHDKAALLAKMHTWLRPGGTLLIADHCCSASTPPSEGLRAHMQRHAYDLRTADAYVALLRDAGFVDVVVEDRTWQLQGSLERELALLQASRASLVGEFGEEVCDALENEWRDALGRVGAGEQRWVVLVARA